MEAGAGHHGTILAATGLGRRGLLNPYAIAIFCEALIGLAIANHIAGFEALPVARAVIRRERIARQVVLWLAAAVLVVVLEFFIGAVGIDIGRQLFGETNYTREAAGTMPGDKWQLFWLFLSGAGIAEETPYRLVLVSFVWKLTGRRGLAILIAALVFGAYHLTPLSGMYRVFWQFPVSQFTASALIGLIWGWLFVKRGYETAALGHTLSDWLPVMLFM